MTSYRSLIPLVALVILLTGYNFIAASWIAPSSAPAGDNRPAPITTDAAAQTKQGNFIANILLTRTAVWSPQYCDENGSNCWDPATGTGGGGTGGGSTITVGGRCFAPALAVTCNWNWSGDGNDNSTYVRPIGSNVGGVCSGLGRAYQYHNVVLAECMTRTFSWYVTSGRCSVQPPSDCTTAYGQYIRTVECRDQFGTVEADSNCPAPKPPTRYGSCSARSTGSSCR